MDPYHFDSDDDVAIMEMLQSNAENSVAFSDGSDSVSSFSDDDHSGNLVIYIL